MSNIFMTTVLLSFCLQISQACHSAEDEDRRRKKRQSENELGNTEILREYFMNCLQNEVGEIWEWRSVIDTTVLDTNWYESSAQFNCSSTDNDDTVECWSNRLNDLLASSSFLMEPTRQCINQYSVDTDRGIAAQSSMIFQPLLQNTDPAPPTRCMEPMAEPYRPNAPKTRQYASCGDENYNPFNQNRNQLDFPSVLQFVAEHTVCSSELSGCDDNNNVVASTTDSGVPDWPYRFQALTKSSSPLRSIISMCNTLTFPLRTEWSIWGECSVTCGGGTQTRSRECSDQGCSTMESRSCSETQCPECQISRFSRRSCAMTSMSREQCLQRDCCFDRGSCYRSRSNGRQRQPMNGPEEMNQCSSSSMGIRFRPTQASIRSSGGETGYPGSTLRFDCDDGGRIIPCATTNMNCNSCARMACCWSERRRICYRPQISVPVIRKVCPPGFENPPACSDINDCTSTSCMNGGVCIDRIQGFECRCVAPFSGTFCEIAPEICSTPPVVNFGTPSSTGPFYIGDSVTYICVSGYRLSGSATLFCQESGTFSPIPPTCSRLCTSQPPTSAGVLYNPVLSEYGENAVVTYSCSDNGILSFSPASNQCKNGIWINSPPSCFSCPPPLPISQGYYRPIQVLYNAGDEVTYLCLRGLTVVGQNVITCSVSGTWNQTSAPTCSVRDCPALSSIDNGIITPSSVLETTSPIGNIAQYSCNTGFIPTSLVSQTECVALVSGAGWLPILTFECSQGCVPPSLNDQVLVEPSADVYQPGDMINLSCPSGFTLIGSATVTCTASQDYTFPGSESATCTASCGNPPHPPQNAILLGINPSPDVSGTYLVGTVVTYQCQNRSLASGISSISCLETGWEAITLTCTIVCFLSETPDFDPTTTSQVPFGEPPYMVGATVSYSCINSLQTISNGPDTVTCEVTGGWTPANIGQCGFSFCPAFLPVVNANINPVIATQSPQPLNTTVTVTCNTGYYLSPSTADFTCQTANNGPPQYFPTQAPVCLRGCSYPTNNLPRNATFAPPQVAFTGLFAQGAPLSITCDSGFTVSGPSSHTCQPESNPQFPTLISDPTVCQPNCPLVSSLTFPANSNVSSVSQTQVFGTMPVGTIATFSCNTGYGLNGTATITCLPTGMYSAFIFNCAKVCPDPPPEIANGSRAMSSSDSAPYFPGMRVTYQCNSGFTANNPSNLINRCIVQNLNPVWEKNAMELFTICRPNVNFILLIATTLLGSFCQAGQLSQQQRNFVTGFQSAWGDSAVAQKDSGGTGSQIAVGYNEGITFVNVSSFFDDITTRNIQVANARIQACGSFSPGVLIGNAQRTFTEQNGLNTSLPIYYLLVFDISVWGTTNENVAISTFRQAIKPIQNVVFPIAATPGTPLDVSTFFRRYYTVPGSNLQSVTPGLYFDFSTSGLPSIVDNIVRHCKINNC